MASKELLVILVSLFDLFDVACWAVVLSLQKGAAYTVHQMGSLYLASGTFGDWYVKNVLVCLHVCVLIVRQPLIMIKFLLAVEDTCGVYRAAANNLDNNQP